MYVQYVAIYLCISQHMSETIKISAWYKASYMLKECNIYVELLYFAWLDQRVQKFYTYHIV